MRSLEIVLFRKPSPPLDLEEKLVLCRAGLTPGLPHAPRAAWTSLPPRQRPSRCPSMTTPTRTRVSNLTNCRYHGADVSSMRAGDGSPRARVAQQQPQPQEQPQFRTAIAADATAIDGSALATSTPSFKKLARVVQRELGHRDRARRAYLRRDAQTDPSARPPRSTHVVRWSRRAFACSRRGDRHERYSRSRRMTWVTTV